MKPFLVTTTVALAWLWASIPASSQDPDARSVTAVPTTALNPERRYDFRTADPKLLAMRADSTQAIVTTDCTTLRYDLSSSPPQKLQTWPEVFDSVCFSRDGRFVLTVGRDRVVVWDVTTGSQIQKFHDGALDRGRFSHSPPTAISNDGALVAVSNLGFRQGHLVGKFVCSQVGCDSLTRWSLHSGCFTDSVSQPEAASCSTGTAGNDQTG